MSMIPTPGVTGVLQSSAPSSASVMTIDGAYAAYLLALLPTGAWTYVTASVGNTAEVFKITGISGQVITVVRGLDNTVALNFAAGELITFTMGASATTDFINAAALAPALTITGSGGITVVRNSASNYTISMPTVGITSTNASLIVTSASASQFDLAINTTAIGYCATA